MYVIDTNTLIYFFKGMGSVPAKFLEVSPKNITIPSIVLYELESGIMKSTFPRKRQPQLKELCSLVEVLPFDSEAARLSELTLKRKAHPLDIVMY